MELLMKCVPTGKMKQTQPSIQQLNFQQNQLLAANICHTCFHHQCSSEVKQQPLRTDSSTLIVRFIDNKNDRETIWTLCFRRSLSAAIYSINTMEAACENCRRKPEIFCNSVIIRKIDRLSEWRNAIQYNSYAEVVSLQPGSKPIQIADRSKIHKPGQERQIL
jgi:outer membrane murein-binding lipoprotein Lpp